MGAPMGETEVERVWSPLTTSSTSRSMVPGVGGTMRGLDDIGGKMAGSKNSTLVLHRPVFPFFFLCVSVDRHGHSSCGSHIGLVIAEQEPHEHSRKKKKNDAKIIQFASSMSSPAAYPQVLARGPLLVAFSPCVLPPRAGERAPVRGAWPASWCPGYRHPTCGGSAEKRVTKKKQIEAEMSMLVISYFKFFSKSPHTSSKRLL